MSLRLFIHPFNSYSFHEKSSLAHLFFQLLFHPRTIVSFPYSFIEIRNKKKEGVNKKGEMKT